MKAPIKKKGLLFLISGPSGSGKTTLATALIKDKRFASKLARSVSATTRKKRYGEKDGRDYFFVSRQDFLRRRNSKKILEWTQYLGYYYGTPKEFVEGKLASGKSLVMCLDYRGLLQLKKFYARQLRTIFIIPPSIGELRRRIISRCPNIALKEIRRRLNVAKKELKFAGKYDYRLVNKQVKRALSDLKKIVQKELEKER